MRISTNQFFNTSMNNIQENQQKLAQTQEQLSSGKKLLRPSDNPTDMNRAIRLTEELASVSQYQRNNTMLTTALERQDAVLQSIETAMDSAYQLTLQGNSGIMTDTDRKILAEEMTQIREQVFSLMNSRDGEGNYMFSGSDTSKQPFIYQSNATVNQYQYQGNDDVNQIRVSESVNLQSVDNGKQLFSTQTAVNMDVSAAEGSAISKLQITDQTTFNNYHQANYSATQPFQNQFQLSVVDNGGQDQLVLESPPGSGINMLPTTVYDPTNGNQVSVNGISIDVEQGLSAGNNSTFSLQAPQQRNILESLNDVINLFNTDNPDGTTLQQGIENAMSEMTKGQERISIARASTGSRLSSAERYFDNAFQQRITAQTELSTIQDVDFAAASSRLVQQETALNAAFASFGKVANLSLFNYI